MTNTDTTHVPKQPRRPHYIQEWAETRGYNTQSELSIALGADKSVVNRWYSGTSPSKDWQTKLAVLLHCDRESLFRHPDDDWIVRFIRNRKRDEIERIKKMLELAFPPKNTDTDC